MACSCSPLFYVFWRKNWLYLSYNAIPLLIILSGWTLVIFGYLYGVNKSVFYPMEVFETKEDVSNDMCAILIVNQQLQTHYTFTHAYIHVYIVRVVCTGAQLTEQSQRGVTEQWERQMHTCLAYSESLKFVCS